MRDKIDWGLIFIFFVFYISGILVGKYIMPNHYENTDVNHDGKTNATDLLIVRKALECDE